MNRDFGTTIEITAILKEWFVSENTIFDDFIEYRADHLELDELARITTETEFYNNVVKKLMARGSKVIVGPRGVGKTHHMRIAYKKCLHDKSKPLPVYVSFSKYLRLEPLKTTSSIAIQFFHCWILCKILLSIQDTIKELGFLDSIDLGDGDEITWKKIKLFCEQIEKQQQKDWHDSLLENISVSFVSELIEEVIFFAKRKHSIILCDDAALVLTQDYMIEFFDVFRSLKSTKISPKASVYPNTEFGPRFHLGHDAESVHCWPSILDDSYEDLFEGIYEKRFKIDLKDGVKKCFMYASFGVPRAFINLVNNFHRVESSSEQKKVNIVIEEQADLIRDEYLSQGSKQPQFKNYVQAGDKILDKIIKEVSYENKKTLEHQKKQIIFGLKQSSKKDNIQKNIEIVLRLLEETGLLQKLAPVKHGQDRVYDRYIPHFNLLLASGAFQKGRGSYISSFSDHISYPNEKHPMRKASLSEFDEENLLNEVTLDLPNCSSCGRPRSNENQKFCMFCGSELINKSTFETLMSNPIDSLPITNWLKTRVKEETSIDTIGDIVRSSNPSQELRKASGIGEKRASKVISYAESWMNEYLS
jgi:hypothetical protein